jgi:hypothetical protein
LILQKEQGKQLVAKMIQFIKARSFWWNLQEENATEEEDLIGMTNALIVEGTGTGNFT